MTPPSGGSGSRSRALAAFALAAVFALPRAASACPCGPGAAPVSTVTSPGQRVALRTAVTGLLETASWDEGGRARPTPAGVSSTRLLVELAAAWRPWRPVELSVLGGFGGQWVELPGVSSRAFQMGDVSARARWEAFDAAPWRVAGFVTVRAPTGDVAGGALANGVASLGLGVWEFAPGVEVSYRDDDVGQVGASLDAGLRTARDGWHPGARFTATAFGAWRAAERWTLTASASHTWELESARDGTDVPGSSTRRLGLGVGVTWRARDDLALSFGASADPWLDLLGANAVASARATLGATWSR